VRCAMLKPEVCLLVQAFIARFNDVAEHLWQAVSRREFLIALGTEAMDTGMDAGMCVV